MTVCLALSSSPATKPSMSRLGAAWFAAKMVLNALMTRASGRSFWNSSAADVSVASPE
jgi:hypothetical protein